MLKNILFLFDEYGSYRINVRKISKKKYRLRNHFIFDFTMVSKFNQNMLIYEDTKLLEKYVHFYIINKYPYSIFYINLCKPVLRNKGCIIIIAIFFKSYGQNIKNKRSILRLDTKSCAIRSTGWKVTNESLNLSKPLMFLLEHNNKIKQLFYMLIIYKIDYFFFLNVKLIGACLFISAE